GGNKSINNLHCLGFLDRMQMQEWLAKASIYVAPALYEPFGLAILEAARSGCALVLSDIRSLREVWGDAAEYVDPEDGGQLRQTLLKLIHDPERRRQLAERALHKARSYSADDMSGDYLCCYHSLATGNINFSVPSISTLLGVRP